jgi:diguanylate cyclase (GGDEF)-like protein
MLLLGVGATIFVTLQVKKDSESTAKAEFAMFCDQVTLKIRERLGTYAMILQGCQGLFAASTTVDREAWKAYAKDLLAGGSTISGVQGIGFSKLILPKDLAANIAAIRAEGFPEYTVWPLGKRAIYTSIIYIEPFRDRNLRAFGYDMFSDPVRREAMERARDTGQAALSGKVVLVQETKTAVQAGTLMYVPVYRNGTPTDTLEQRRAAILGWVYSPYRMNDLMKGILADESPAHVADFRLYEGKAGTPSNLLFQSTIHKPHKIRMPFKRTIQFSGQEWLLVFEPATPLVNYTLTWATLVGGLAVSGLLCGLMLSLLHTKSCATQFENISNHDRLTQLANRAYLDRYLEHAASRAQANSEVVVLAFLDLNGFKAVNDSFGHEEGDAVLRSVAQSLREQCREGDLVARYGGDEFVVVFVASAANRQTTVARMKQVLSNAFEPIGQQLQGLKVSAAVGISVYPDPAPTIAQLLKTADQSMYRVKRHGELFAIHEYTGQDDL